jgi:hypothetical protein
VLQGRKSLSSFSNSDFPDKYNRHLDITFFGLIIENESQKVHRLFLQENRKENEALLLN